MKAIYLDPFAGISGNMFLGALLDAGFPLEVLKEELQKLHIGEYELVYRQVNKLGIEAKYFNVLLPEEHEHHHEHHHEHEHEHHNEHSHEHEHHHHNDHSELTHTHHHHEHRNLNDVMAIVNSSDLSDSIKAKTEQVFRAIAVAEGKVHGKPLEEVHFHEVGAIDTIIDIVGTLIGLEYLGIEKIYVGRINTGFGYVECAHGTMPVPAPATAELLQGLPQERGIVAKEMTTPTGAALMRVLAEVSLEQPAAFSSERIAYGAGTREVAIPNVLRMYVGQVDEAGEGQLIEAACNIDDMTGEVFGYTMERMLKAGALDAWAEPIVMKKSRPAYKLSFICEEAKLQDILAVVFAETTTLGVRYHKVDRCKLDRSFIAVNLPEGQINVKCGSINGHIVTMAPEYADCVKIAEATGQPLADVMQKARQVAEAGL